jgi:hypothetical protein
VALGITLLASFAVGLPAPVSTTLGVAASSTPFGAVVCRDDELSRWTKSRGGRDRGLERRPGKVDVRVSPRDQALTARSSPVSRASKAGGRSLPTRIGCRLTASSAASMGASHSQTVKLTPSPSLSSVPTGGDVSTTTIVPDSCPSA